MNMEREPKRVGKNCPALSHSPACQRFALPSGRWPNAPNRKTHEAMMPRLLIAVLLAFVLGCGDSTGPADSIHGTYKMQSIQGHTLPWAYQDIYDTKFEITHGSFALNPGGSYTQIIGHRNAIGTRVSVYEDTVRGVFTDYGAGLVKMKKDGATATFDATLAGRTLTIGQHIYTR